MAIVLDASALIAKLTSNEEFAQEIEDLTENNLVIAPDVILLEVISGLYKMSLRKEISSQFFKSTYLQVSQQDITLVPSKDIIPQIDDLLGNITAYDASYVNLARKLNIPLCTIDKKLANSASRYCEVIYCE